MKQKKYIYILLLLFFTSIGLWIISTLVKSATYEPDRYPFVYYSSVLKQLGFVDFSNKETPLTDREGKTYNQSQFDSVMPLLNYRQLMSDGRMPDSIGGYAVTMQLMRVHSVNYRFNPTHINSPQPKLHILYESMPKRVGITAPNDAFRFKDKMKFIVADGNYVDQTKSHRFNLELTKRGFTFPAKGVWGNPNPRKPYDEGYFCLDSKGDLFHIKMVNGRPFVRNTFVSQNIDIAFFAMHEVATKRYYGYLFDKGGNVYILEAEDGKYIPTRLDIDPIDLSRDRMTIMGNLLYWTISVVRAKRMDAYALDAFTLERLEDYSFKRTPSLWDKVSKYLFPYYLDFSASNSYYIYPRIVTTGLVGFFFNIFLAFCTLLIFRKKQLGPVFPSVFVLLTGIAGLIALLLLPGTKAKGKKLIKVGLSQPCFCKSK